MRTAGLMGKLPKKHSPKTLDFNKYLLPGIPPAPMKTYWEYKIPDDAWNMFKNDSIGDCTCAAIAHMLMLTTVHTGKIVIPTEQDVLDAYTAVSGYDQQTGANDNGAVIVDVLNYWQTHGIAGHKILGWAEIDQTDLEKMKQGIYIFGGVDLGANMPQSSMDQFESHKPWRVADSATDIIGGHSFPVFGYGRAGETCVTWAERQQINWAWHTKYVDEAYVVITNDWINEASGLAPNALNLDQLQTDIKAIT